MQVTIFTANCIGQAANCSYPNKVTVVTPEQLRERLKSVVACVRSGIPVHRAGPTDLFYYLMGNLGWWK